jgi:7-cyano-7-deazaguanine reductase
MTTCPPGKQCSVLGTFPGDSGMAVCLWSEGRVLYKPPVMPSQPSKKLETFKNPAPQRDYTITFDIPEFTCLCPMTGQPDFATFKIRYVPDQLCVELKSLKMYFWSYRNEGAFHEAVTNRICDDLVAALKPRSLTVEGDFFVRGGIGTLVTATYEKPRRKAA